MKKLWLGLLLTLVSVAYAHDDPHGYEIRNAICAATQWENCEEVTPPVAVLSTSIVKFVQDTMGPGWFLYGFTFPGEPYIYVRTDIPRIRMFETLVHESVHYYYHQTKTGTDRCESEYYARYYTTKVLSTPFDTTWWERYSCPDYKNAVQP